VNNSRDIAPSGEAEDSVPSVANDLSILPEEFYSKFLHHAAAKLGGSGQEDGGRSDIKWRRGAYWPVMEGKRSIAF
jgi:hypothetical protein